ncbi:MAG: hypothetical protein KAU62_01100 [Candidatus Heimdallarchaeota archaeon]|nr:hypothetical protein [Candidatus Heimdallarchaeota archaeon]MCG3254649.1 hypothetical protein [Candidatus Heimdallarchaeota archaeon]MCK4609730.1 hypothetical protein [Candidatus Heimdallarchaeota archaeon]
MFKKRKHAILENMKDQSIILGPVSANNYGQESKGKGQVRGMGLLFLTDKEVYFGMYVPKKDFHILIDHIHGISIPKWYLGKTRSKPLLKLTFTNNEGELDSLAWQVKDLDLWVNTIEDQLKK